MVCGGGLWRWGRRGKEGGGGGGGGGRSLHSTRYRRYSTPYSSWQHPFSPRGRLEGGAQGGQGGGGGGGGAGGGLLEISSEDWYRQAYCTVRSMEKEYEYFRAAVRPYGSKTFVARLP